MDKKTGQEKITRQVSQEEDGLRLDKCLRKWIPHLPQSMIEKASRKGFLRVDGAKGSPSLRVKEGQRIEFPSEFFEIKDHSEKKKEYSLTYAQKKWIKELILYENEDLVILNKPSGLSVQGGTKQKKSLDVMIQAYYETCKPRLVHRLDRDTSGVLVMAKSIGVARHLTQAFKERKVQKIYWAIVCGVPQKKEGVISLPLSKKADPLGEKVRVDKDTGLPATTAYAVIESLGNRLSWLELRPKTGRMHQLRVHCAEGLKTPILGDGKYGGNEAFPFGRTSLHLHARVLIIPMGKGNMIRFEAPLPRELRTSFQTLGFENV